MRAAVNTRYGSPDVLKIRHVPKPEPGAGEVLVRVHATTGERPSVRLPADQARLIALPAIARQGVSAPVRHNQVIPVESLQHPLSVYDSLLEVAA